MIFKLFQQMNKINTLKLRLHDVTFIRKDNFITRSYSSTMNSFNWIHNMKINTDFSGRPQMILKRSLNKDTNAAGVWDTFPDPFHPIVEKSAETAIDEENYPNRKKNNLTSRINEMNGEKKKRPILSPRVMDAVLTTVMGLAAVGFGGVFYNSWYEWNEVHKVKLAFTKPSPLLKSRRQDSFIKREEMKTIGDFIAGKTQGKYFLLVGERGTGKTQLILNAMEKINQYGVVFSEAHSDSEIFKVRLGKALNYTYREDYVGQLFAREAPERGSALLDVEKALNMVEAVAVKYRRKYGRPLVLVINNIHAFKNDEDGEDLLELLQQRAEAWAATRVVTMVFNTDDYSIYERMKRDASRLSVVRVSELKPEEAVSLLKERRKGKEPEEELLKIVERIGGRLSSIDKLAREPHIYETAKHLENEERTWIINQIGLIPDFEETAFDEQKYASCAWKLIREIVKSPNHSIPINDGRIITGNPKWIEMMDHDNIIMIDEHENIKADSKILQNIFEEIVNKEGFNELLANVCDRVEDVDKEQRTRELIWSQKNKIRKPWFFW